MSKGIKVTLAIIVVLILIFAVLFFMYQQKKSDTLNENNTTIGNIIQDANTGLDNMLNDILNEENVENTTNTENNNNTSSSNNTTPPTTPNTDNDVTPREKKAQELVKTEWKKVYGNTDGVSFNNVSIQADGKYLISVNDSKTTKVVAWYVVNVDTGVVNEK